MLRRLFTRALDRKGDAVAWVLVIIISIILAVIAFKYLAPGIKGAAQGMSNALLGQ